MNEFETLLRSPATLVLLVVNLVLSFAALQNVRLMERLLFDVNRIRRFGEWYRMITSAFIHGDGIHLLFNMLTLFYLGPTLELNLGTFAMIGIYAGSLLAGSLWTWLEHFRDPNYRALGASGAISGVTIAVAMFYPLLTIYLFFALPMPLILFAILYIAWSAWASGSGRRDGIGHAAHLGGALAGAAIVCIWWPWAPQQMIDQVMGALRGL